MHSANVGIRTIRKPRLTVDLVNLLQLALASGCLTAGLMLAPRTRLRALTALLIVFAVHMSFNALEESRALPSGLLITPAFGLLYGPLVLLFVRRIVISTSPDLRLVAAHFIPAAIALGATRHIEIVRAAALFSFIIYGVATLRMIGRYHAATAATRSDAMSIRLSWVTQVFAGFAVLTVVDLLRMATAPWQSQLGADLAYAVVLASGGGLLGALVYQAVAQPEYFKGLSDFSRPLAAGPTDQAAPADADIFKRIERAVVDDGLHRRAHLTLADVASATLLTEREVSRAINSVGGRSFCDYINNYRVREVCATMESGGTATILDLAFEAGFTSKSSFNAVFKRETGMTPSEYRRRAVSNS